MTVPSRFRVVRDRDYHTEGHAETEQRARLLAIRLAIFSGEDMRILPECALIGETLVVPNNRRIDSNSGAWKKS